MTIRIMPWNPRRKKCEPLAAHGGTTATGLLPWLKQDASTSPGLIPRTGRLLKNRASPARSDCLAGKTALRHFEQSVKQRLRVKSGCQDLEKRCVSIIPSLPSRAAEATVEQITIVLHLPFPEKQGMWSDCDFQVWLAIHSHHIEPHFRNSIYKRSLPACLSKAPRAVLQRSGRLLLTDDGRSASHSAVMMTPSNQHR